MRDLTSGFIAELDSDAMRMAILLEIQFDSGTIYLWTGEGDFDYGGNTYTGVGNTLGFDTVKEVTDIQSIGVTATVPVTSAFISTALQEEYQGRTALMHLAVFDITSGALISDPYQFFQGLCDVMAIEDMGSTANVSVTFQSEIANLFRAKDSNYTPEDQRTKYPMDRGLDLITSIQDVEVVWNANG